MLGRCMRVSPVNYTAPDDPTAIVRSRRTQTHAHLHSQLKPGDQSHSSSTTDTSKTRATTLQEHLTNRGKARGEKLESRDETHRTQRWRDCKCVYSCVCLGLQ
ncbi:hypothetical protein E2C01_089124 [Portunus trituberculatus]|uniref:Uncharacterized protein n=1 Tax=Portunus trituberculatus TaxID=210409 RepID=A0A5B7JI90_PORTR|nr:hypothetical protein [Portunus trituberculatus]